MRLNMFSSFFVKFNEYSNIAKMINDAIERYEFAKELQDLEEMKDAQDEIDILNNELKETESQLQFPKTLN